MSTKRQFTFYMYNNKRLTMPELVREIVREELKKTLADMAPVLKRLKEAMERSKK